MRSAGEWDGTAWIRLMPLASSPLARGRAAMAFDARRRQTVLFGGGDYQIGVPFAETWGNRSRVVIVFRSHSRSRSLACVVERGHDLVL